MPTVTDMPERQEGYKPFVFRGNVFYANPEATHVAMDFDGEIHTYTSEPHVVRCIDDTPDNPKGYYCHSDGNEGEYVGAMKVYDSMEWVVSVEPINWGELH